VFVNCAARKEKRHLFKGMLLCSSARLSLLVGAFRLTFAWAVIIGVAVCIAGMMLLLHRTPLGTLVHKHIPDRPRRRLLLASIGFFLTFACVRILTWSIHNDIGPFHDVEMGGRHIHHLVWGIALLISVGFGWLVEFGTGSDDSSIFASRLMSLLYGAGAALTLDEFALWLNLRDVYWSREGRASVEVALMFGSLLAIGAFGAPVFSALTRRRR
jgi:hypothetical protein